MPPGSFFNRLVRKKTIVTSTLQDTKLRRCLGLMELTGLGLGSSLGLGVYVITSYAIKNDAGPSFVISVIVAGVAALFSGMLILFFLFCLHFFLFLIFSIFFIYSFFFLLFFPFAFSSSHSLLLFSVHLRPFCLYYHIEGLMEW